MKLEEREYYFVLSLLSTLSLYCCSLCSVGVERTLMMDCTAGPLECMHVNNNKCSAVCICSYHPSLFPSFFPFLLSIRLYPFFSLFNMRAPCTYLFSSGYAHKHTPKHSWELHSLQGTTPWWPQWLITFNKANRVLLVRINLFPVLVWVAVTSNCQSLCSMKWGPLSLLSGPKLTIASIFYTCASALLLLWCHCPFPPRSLFFHVSTLVFLVKEVLSWE